MGERVKVGQVDQFTPGKGKLVKVKGYEVALFNVDGSFYAISNSCPHSTGPLAEGRLHGTTVTCPWHGSQFNVVTGKCDRGPATQPVNTYPVYIEGHSIFIEIN